MPRPFPIKREIKITLPKKQAETIHRRLVGEFGNNPADVVKTMVYDWLKANGLISFSQKKRRKK